MLAHPLNHPTLFWAFVRRERLHRFRGTVGETTLTRAGINTTRTVVLGDALAPPARDAQVVLATPTVESLNLEGYTTVEVDKANVGHCRRALADEVSAASGVGGYLSASSNLTKRSLPAELTGRPFLEVLTRTREQDGTLMLAVQRGLRGEAITTPAADPLLQAGDEWALVGARGSA